MKILILGHKGLLGNMVLAYYKSINKYSVITTNFRWNNKKFKDFVIDIKPDFIINCIGLIPQRKPNDNLYNEINYELPLWLDSLGINIIHPDTDEPGDTPYGLSKQMARENINRNTKILKTSIIGFEKNTNFSLLNWFLNSMDSVNGYTNQFWNGNTTLEWAKWSEKLILNWNAFSNITTLANPNCISKYEILILIKTLFQKDIKIIPVEAPISKNNCLKGDFITNDLTNQLIEMKYFVNEK